MSDAADKIPPSLKLILGLTTALRSSGFFLLDHCSANELAMQQYAINEELLNMAEPAIQKALTMIEQVQEEATPNEN